VMTHLNQVIAVSDMRLEVALRDVLLIDDRSSAAIPRGWTRVVVLKYSRHRDAGGAVQRIRCVPGAVAVFTGVGHLAAPLGSLAIEVLDGEAGHESQKAAVGSVSLSTLAFQLRQAAAGGGQAVLVSVALLARDGSSSVVLGSANVAISAVESDTDEAWNVSAEVAARARAGIRFLVRRARVGDALGGGGARLPNLCVTCRIVAAGAHDTEVEYSGVAATRVVEACCAPAWNEALTISIDHDAFEASFVQLQLHDVQLSPPAGVLLLHSVMIPLVALPQRRSSTVGLLFRGEVETGAPLPVEILLTMSAWRSFADDPVDSPRRPTESLEVGVCGFTSPVPSWWLGVGVAAPPAVHISQSAAAGALEERELTIATYLSTARGARDAISGVGSHMCVPLVTVEHGFVDFRALGESSSESTASRWLAHPALHKYLKAYPIKLRCVALRCTWRFVFTQRCS
jgi:hypothetical protein